MGDRASQHELVASLRAVGADATAAAVSGPGELLAAAAGEHPDVALIDLDLEVPATVGDATSLVEPLRALGVKVLALADPHEASRLYAAVATGVDGIVDRSVSATEIVAAARNILDGATLIGESIRQQLGPAVVRQRSREETEPAIHHQRRSRERGLISPPHP